MFAEEWLKTVVVDVQGKRYTNEYLPKSVWKTRGFSEEQIMACNDTMDHPLFGQLYGLSLLTKYVEHEERQERGEKTTVTDDCAGQWWRNGCWQRRPQDGIGGDSHQWFN